MTTPALSAGLALLAGMLTVLSPCVLPVLPVIVGRSLQSHRYGPIALVVGLVSGFAVAGSLLGFTSQWISGFANLLRMGAIALLLTMGVLSLFPKWSDQLFSSWRLGGLKEPAQTGLVGEFCLGTQLGLLWTPCAGPILGSILVLAAVQHQVTSTFFLLMTYGIGAGVPLLAIAYFGRHFSRSLLKLRPHTAVLQRMGGGLVSATAIAILLGWDVQIQLWLAPLFPALPL